MAAQTTLTPQEERFRKAITEVVDRRAQLEREVRESSQQIAALCVDARAEGVRMALLAEWVKVLKGDELRSVSRQAVDQMVAAFEGRERAPRTRRRQRGADNGHQRASSINMDAFA